jgi:hypothetical protein
MRGRHCSACSRTPSPLRTEATNLRTTLQTRPLTVTPLDTTTKKHVAILLHLQAVRLPPALHRRSHRPRRHRHWSRALLQSGLIAGANVGLGLEAARHLARFNPQKLILACRNQERGDTGVRYITETTSVAAGVVECWQLDLASFDSVKAFAKRGPPPSKDGC